MGGWMNGWMDGFCEWMDGVNGWMDRQCWWMNGWLDGFLGRWVDRLVDIGWVWWVLFQMVWDKCMNGCGWRNRRTDRDRQVGKHKVINVCDIII